MSSWSTECGGYVPFRLKAAASEAFARPFVPGGRTFRKPPKSPVPYGSGAAAAGAASARAQTIAAAVRASSFATFEDVTNPPPRLTEKAQL
jgi:hypothetical protein